MKCWPAGGREDHLHVAPCAGAGIEIGTVGPSGGYYLSPPARGRGLKLTKGQRDAKSAPVAPCAGAGIEMLSEISQQRKQRGRPLRGGGD